MLFSFMFAKIVLFIYIDFLICVIFFSFCNNKRYDCGLYIILTGLTMSFFCIGGVLKGESSYKNKMTAVIYIERFR